MSNDLLVNALKGTRRNIREVCDELGIDIPDNLELNTCSHCGVWAGKLKDDLDGNPVCGFCLINYGA